MTLEIYDVARMAVDHDPRGPIVTPRTNQEPRCRELNACETKAPLFINIVLRISESTAADIPLKATQTFRPALVSDGTSPIIHITKQADVQRFLLALASRSESADLNGTLAGGHALPSEQRATTPASASARGGWDVDKGDGVRLSAFADAVDGQRPETRAGYKFRASSSLPKWRLTRVVKYIEANLAEQIKLTDLATVAGLSRMYFASQFRIATGLPPHHYVLKKRIEYAQQQMVRSSDSLAEIALAVGFQSQAHFTTTFKKLVGQTPYRWGCDQRCGA